MATKLEKEIIQKMDGKRTFGQIGQEFGLSYQTIKSIAERNGIERPPSLSKSKRLEMGIMEALESGSRLKDITKKFKVSSNLVKKVANQNDFSIDERRTRNILRELETATSYKEVAEKLGVSSKRVSDIAKANDIKLTRKGFPAKIERNIELVGLIKEGNLTYPQLGEKYGISKARVQQFAKANGISRWELSRKKYKALAEAIEVDYADGLSYDEIKTKHNLSNVNLGSLKRYGYTSLFNRFQEDRNAVIVEEYKKKTAKKVLNSSDPSLDSPDRLTAINSVYNISRRKGFKKYPNVGNRSGGGIFEKPEIIKFIKKKRDKNELSFNEISTLMIAKGWKTPCGKEYSEANVRQKYHAIKKHNA